MVFTWAVVSSMGMADAVVLFPRRDSEAMVCNLLRDTVPAARVPIVVMLVDPAHVLRAVFSTLLRLNTVFAWAAVRAIGMEAPAVLFPRMVDEAMVAMFASGTVPAARVPMVVMLVVPGHVLRAVFSTASKLRSVFTWAVVRAIGTDAPPVLFPRMVDDAMVAIRAKPTVPAARVPIVVMFVDPAHVLRAVFSTLLRLKTVFAWAAVNAIGTEAPPVLFPRMVEEAMVAMFASGTVPTAKVPMVVILVDPDPMRSE